MSESEGRKGEPGQFPRGPKSADFQSKTNNVKYQKMKPLRKQENDGDKNSQQQQLEHAVNKKAIQITNQHMAI